MKASKTSIRLCCLLFCLILLCGVLTACGNPTAPKNITGIDLVTSPKTSYYYGEELDLSDLSVKVSYKKADPATLTYQEIKENLTVTGYDKTKVGTQKVTATYKVSDKKDTYTGSVEFNVTVSKYAGSLSFTENYSLDKVYDGNAVAVSTQGYQYNGDGEVTAEWFIKGSDTPLAQAPKNAGEYTVVIKSGATEKYTEATAQKDFAITKQTVPAATYTEGNFVYDGNEKTANISANDLYTVSGDKATNAGSYTATVALKDTANYVWAEGAKTSFAWAIAKQTVPSPVYTEGNFIYDGNEKTANIAASNLYTVSGNKATNAGSYTATVALKDTANYVWAEGAKTSFAWAIAKQTVPSPIYTEGNFIYDGNEKTANISASDLYTVSGNKATAVGSYHAVVTLKDSDNYTWAADAVTEFDWAISTATGNLAFVSGYSLDKTYDGSPVTAPTASNYDQTGDGAVSVSWFVRNGTGYVAINAAPTDAGEYKVVISSAGTNSYTAATAELTFTVAKADYNMSGITFANDTVTYNGGTHSLAISGTLQAGLTVSYDVKDLVNAGTYTVVASFTSSNDNYNLPANMTATLTIEKAENDVNFHINLGKEFDGDPVSIGNNDYSFDGNGTPSAPVWYDRNDNMLAGAPSDAGTYYVIITVSEGDNYLEGSARHEFTILRKGITAPSYIDNENLRYTGSSLSPSISAGEGYTIVGDMSGVNAGSYTAYARLLNNNYAWADTYLRDDVPLNWSILPQFVEKPAHNGSVLVYNELSQSAPITSHVAYQHEEDSDSAKTDAGTYLAKIGLANDNYVWEDGSSDVQNISWSILPQEVASPVQVSPLTYNGALQTVSFTASDLYAQTLESVDQARNAGTYEAVFALTDTDNYIWADTENSMDLSVNWTIAKKQLNFNGAAGSTGGTNAPAVRPYSNDESTMMNGIVMGSISNSLCLNTETGLNDIVQLNMSASLDNKNVGNRTLTVTYSIKPGTPVGAEENYIAPAPDTFEVEITAMELHFSISFDAVDYEEGLTDVLPYLGTVSIIEGLGNDDGKVSLVIDNATIADALPENAKPVTITAHLDGEEKDNYAIAGNALNGFTINVNKLTPQFEVSADDIFAPDGSGNWLIPTGVNIDTAWRPINALDEEVYGASTLIIKADYESASSTKPGGVEANDIQLIYQTAGNEIYNPGLFVMYLTRASLAKTVSAEDRAIEMARNEVKYIGASFGNTFVALNAPSNVDAYVKAIDKNGNFVTPEIDGKLLYNPDQYVFMICPGAQYGSMTMYPLEALKNVSAEASNADVALSNESFATKYYILDASALTYLTFTMSMENGTGYRVLTENITQEILEINPIACDMVVSKSQLFIVKVNMRSTATLSFTDVSHILNEPADTFILAKDAGASTDDLFVFDSVNSKEAGKKKGLASIDVGSLDIQEGDLVIPALYARDANISSVWTSDKAPDASIKVYFRYESKTMEQPMYLLEAEPVTGTNTYPVVLIEGRVLTSILVFYDWNSTTFSGSENSVYPVVSIGAEIPAKEYSAISGGGVNLYFTASAITSGDRLFTAYLDSRMNDEDYFFVYLYDATGARINPDTYTAKAYYMTPKTYNANGTVTGGSVSMHVETVDISGLIHVNDFHDEGFDYIKSETPFYIEISGVTGEYYVLFSSINDSNLPVNYMTESNIYGNENETKYCFVFGGENGATLNADIDMSGGAGGEGDIGGMPVASVSVYRMSDNEQSIGESTINLDANTMYLVKIEWIHDGNVRLTLQ